MILNCIRQQYVTGNVYSNKWLFKNIYVMTYVFLCRGGIVINTKYYLYIKVTYK